MPLIKYINRLERIHSLISKKSTGTPEQLAEKLGMSRSMTLNYLAEMKSLGAPIAYDQFLESYYYTENVKFIPGFKRDMSDSEMNQLKAGNNFSSPIILDLQVSYLTCF